MYYKNMQFFNKKTLVRLEFAVVDSQQYEYNLLHLRSFSNQEGWQKTITYIHLRKLDSIV